MATLNDPVKVQEIIDRFKDFVDATANSGIVWGTGAKPFPELTDAEAAKLFGGTPAAGRASTLTPDKVNKSGVVSAKDIIDALLVETTAFTRLRNIRMILNVTGDGGNTGTRPTKGYVFDQTKKANLSTSYITKLAESDLPNTLQVKLNNTITRTSLEGLFAELRSAYAKAAANTSAAPGQGSDIMQFNGQGQRRSWNGSAFADTGISASLLQANTHVVGVSANAGETFRFSGIRVSATEKDKLRIDVVATEGGVAGGSWTVNVSNGMAPVLVAAGQLFARSWYGSDYLVSISLVSYNTTAKTIVFDLGYSNNGSTVATGATRFTIPFTVSAPATTGGLAPYIVSVCHASCHSSCHGSRGRR